jgi:hypothetical protein
MEEGETGAVCSRYGRYKKYIKIVKENREKDCVWVNLG